MMTEAPISNLDVIDRFTYEFRRLNGDVSIPAVVANNGDNENELTMLLKLVTLLEMVGSPLRYPNLTTNDQKPNSN